VKSLCLHNNPAASVTAILFPASYRLNGKSALKFAWLHRQQDLTNWPLTLLTWHHILRYSEKCPACGQTVRECKTNYPDSVTELSKYSVTPAAFGRYLAYMYKLRWPVAWQLIDVTQQRPNRAIEKSVSSSRWLFRRTTAVILASGWYFCLAPNLHV